MSLPVGWDLDGMVAGTISGGLMPVGEQSFARSREARETGRMEFRTQEAMDLSWFPGFRIFSGHVRECSGNFR
jgi:hypothetical protein